VLTTNNATPYVGQSVTFSLSVTNNGSSTLTNVLGNLQVAGQLLTPSPSSGVTLASGQNQVFTFTYPFVGSSDPCNLNPVSAVTGTGPSGQFVQQVTNTPTINVQRASLAIGIAQNIPSSAVVGQTITPNIPILNTGCLAVNLLTYTVTNPTAMRSLGFARPAADTVIVTVNPVLPGQTSTAISSHTFVSTDPAIWRVAYAFTGAAQTQGAPIQTLTLSITSGTYVVNLQGGTGATSTPGTSAAGTGTSNNTGGSVNNGSFVLTKSTTSGTAAPGGTVIFTLTLQNLSSSVTLTNVVVTDALDASFTYSSSGTPSGNVTASGQNVTWNVGTLSPGQTVSTTITAKVNTGTGGKTATNVACITSANFSTSTCTSPAISITIGSGTSTLPTTGFMAPDSSNNNLFLILIGGLMALIFVGLLLRNQRA
jgi:uncharacterized repeat protein (TIGR01451 family)